MAKITLVVLAAGIGSRFGGLKQVEPVGPNNELIIDYSIYDALKAGFDKVVFVINENIQELFRERIGKKIEKKVETAYIYQKINDLPADFTVPAGRVKPWGTAHAVLSCQKVVDSPFVSINSDDYYGASAFQMLGSFLNNTGDQGGRPQYAMIGYVLENTLTENGSVARGLCRVNPEGYLQEIHERTRIEKFGEVARYTENGTDWVQIPKGSIVSMNIWGLTPRIFTELETGFPDFLRENQGELSKAEYYLPEAIGHLITGGKARVKVLPTSERWYGVTYQQDKLLVKKAIAELIRAGVYPEKLWAD